MSIADGGQLLQLVVAGTAGGCIYGLVALGFVMIYKATEVVNFAQGDLMMLGGFVAFSLITKTGLGYWAGGALAIATMGAFGYVLDRAVLRRVIGQPQFAVIMLTLGLGFILRAVAGLAFGYHAVTFETPFTNKVERFGDVVIGQDSLSIVAGTVLLCAALHLFFGRTRLGVAMQATSQNQLAAYCVGIPVRTIFSLIWGISAAASTFAGILLAPTTVLDVNLGALAYKAFAAAVLGGFGSLPGALAGGIALGVAEQLAGYYLPTGFQDVTANLVLLAVLIVRPQGLFAQAARKKV